MAESAALLVDEVLPEVCDIYGKKVKVITCIEGPVIIRKILAHLKDQTPVTIDLFVRYQAQSSEHGLKADSSPITGIINRIVSIQTDVDLQRTAAVR